MPAVHCKGLLSRRLPALLWACPAVPQRPTSLIARTFGTLSRPLQLRALCCTRQGNKPALLAASGSEFCSRSARNTQNTAQKNGPRAVSDGFGADSVANSTATGSRSKPVSPTPPAPAGLPEHPVAAWLRQQRKKKQLTDGQWVVFFCAARLGLEQFLAGRTGGRVARCHCKGLLSRRLAALPWACPAVPQRPTSLIARTFGTLGRPPQLRPLCCTCQGNKPALLAASGSDCCFRSARNTRNTAETWQEKK